MKMTTPFKIIQAITLGAMLLGSNVFGAEKCYSTAELNNFKEVYIALQQKLNYEGKDAYLDKNHQVQLKAHQKDAPYGGKEFEEALFLEYQNSMRKVGKLFQNAKFEGDDNFKSNPLLVNFMAAIDDKKSDSSEFIEKTKVKEVLKALEEASIKKFGNGPDKKFVLNAGDKYLLEKLLTHAQDRICSITTFEETGKGTKLFKADYLQKVKNAPLNRLVNTIKASTIDKDSKIELKETSALTASLIDPTLATKSAVAENLQQLSDWVKKVKSRGDKCLQAIKSKNFTNSIQAHIQSCNFGRMIDTLSEDNYNNLESVLHYINANERLLNNPQAKAETNIDELKLEGFIGKTFDNLGKEIRCTQIEASNNADKKIFIRNLPYNEQTNQFDTSGILCKVKGRAQTAEQCKKQYSLVSDSLGRGLEIKPRTANSGVVFSIKENPNCTDMAFPNKPEKPATPPKTQEDCNNEAKEKSEGGKLPVIILILNTEKNTCEPSAPEKKFNWSQEKCDAKAKADAEADKKPVIPVVYDQTADLCVQSPLKPDLTLTQEMCNERAQTATEGGKNKLIPLELNAEKTECVAKEDAGADAETATDDSIMTKEKCDQQSKDSTENGKLPAQNFVFNEKDKSCSVAKLTQADCDAKAKSTAEKEKKSIIALILNAEKNTCDVKDAAEPEKESAKTSDEEKKCIEKSVAPEFRYSWDGKTCVDRYPAKKEEEEKAEEEKAVSTAPTGSKQAPARFVPINIPGRQMYVLPGMP